MALVPSAAVTVARTVLLPSTRAFAPVIDTDASASAVTATTLTELVNLATVMVAASTAVWPPTVNTESLVLLLSGVTKTLKV